MSILSLSLSPPLFPPTLCPICRHFIWDIMDLVIQIAVTMYSKVRCPRFSSKFTRQCVLSQAAVALWTSLTCMHDVTVVLSAGVL